MVRCVYSRKILSVHISVRRVLADAIVLCWRSYAWCAPVAGILAAFEFLIYIGSTQNWPHTLIGRMSTAGPWSIFFRETPFHMPGSAFFLANALLLVFSPILRSALFAVQAAQTRNHAPRLRTALMQGFRCWGKVAGAAILLALIETAVVLAFRLFGDVSVAALSFLNIAPALHGAHLTAELTAGLEFLGIVIVGTSLQFWLAAIVVDDAGAAKTLVNSLDLTLLNWPKALMLYILVSLSAAVIPAVFGGIGMVAGGFTNLTSHGHTVTLVAGWSVGAIVAEPFTVALVLVAYEEFKRNLGLMYLPQAAESK